jgi:hypothetical protein
MIAFRKDQDPDKSEKLLDKLEKILSKIYEDFDNDEIPTFEEVNLSDLLEIVYYNLYIQDNNYMNISIKKDKNNSLKLKIEKIK